MVTATLERERVEMPIPPGTCQCGNCHGSGLFYGRGVIENGVFKGFVGPCYGCGGKGYQTVADQRRNATYWRLNGARWA